MGLKDKALHRPSEKMSDTGFRLMSFTFDIIDLIHPYIDGRVKTFGIERGMTVIDYGCGPGRYTTRFSKLVGETGKVYAVDIHELAIAAVRQKIGKQGLLNVEPVLAQGYSNSLPTHVADVVCALDTFFGVKQPTEFLRELKRVTKPNGMLVIDDGHQSREVTKKNILASGLWTIVEETPDHLKCKPNGS